MREVLKQNVFNGVKYYREEAKKLFKEEHTKLLIQGSLRGGESVAVIIDCNGKTYFKGEEIDTDDLIEIMLKKYVLNDNTISEKFETSDEMYVSKLDKAIKDCKIKLAISYDYEYEGMKAEIRNYSNPRSTYIYANTISELLEQLEYNL